MNKPDEASSSQVMTDIGKIMTGHSVDDLMPALCWLLGEVGAQYMEDKKDFLMLVVRAVGSAYDLNAGKEYPSEQVH